MKTFKRKEQGYRLHYHGQRPQVVLESKIDIIEDGDEDRCISPPSLYTTKNCTVSTNTLHDHAALLLSFVQIAQSEITQCPSALQDDDDDNDYMDTVANLSPIYHRQQHRRNMKPLPCFPKCSDSGTTDDGANNATSSKLVPLTLLPRTDTIRHALWMSSSSSSTATPTTTTTYKTTSMNEATRLRSVSFDSPTSVMKNVLDPWDEGNGTTTKTKLPSPLRPAPSICYTPLISSSSTSSSEHQPKRRSLPSSKIILPAKRSSKYNKTTSVVSKKRVSTSKCSNRTKKLKKSVVPSSSISDDHSISSIRQLNLSHNEDAVAVVFDGDNSNTSLLSSSHQQHTPLQELPPNGIPIVKVFRRKFSWKNYPPLEEFLIQHREEYLHHSALNYTMKQKNYNNTLTHDLLSLATKHGYIFDTTDFNFVTVRDRIRCYYKSYVQSSKKRGILIGYAAKKAGLLNPNDINYMSPSSDHDDEMSS